MNDNPTEEQLRALGFVAEGGAIEIRILQDGDPMLREIAAPITDFEHIPALAGVMLAAMRRATGIGLAAPQIGRSIRLIVAEMNGLTLRMANPVIRIKRGFQMQPDGCLSVDPKLWGRLVTRAKEILVDYQDVEVGAAKTARLKGAMAFCVQHEIDHLDGILFTDRVREKLNGR